MCSYGAILLLFRACKNTGAKSDIKLELKLPKHVAIFYNACFKRRYRFLCSLAKSNFRSYSWKLFLKNSILIKKYLYNYFIFLCIHPFCEFLRTCLIVDRFAQILLFPRIQKFDRYNLSALMRKCQFIN